VQYISEFLPLKKAGRNFKGLCPFHGEKTPSFVVSPERQIWKCFGCQKGGDVFGFLMEAERLEFGEALKILAKRAGVILHGYRPTKLEEDKEKLFEINHLASEYFHYLLLNHPTGKKVLSYILKRGITKESLIKFKIGYSPALWDGLQKYMVGKKGYTPEDLEKSGLVIKKQEVRIKNQGYYYDRFRDRLMFPLFNSRGQITGFSGRVLDPEAKEAKYVNTPETFIYHKSEMLYPIEITNEDIKKENTAMVVEGEIDAISSYQIGIKNVVAIKGSALTEEQSKLLKRYAENIILSLDSDAAGDMASRRGIEIADKIGFNLKILTLENYKDPDEAARKDPEYLKERYKEAENIYDFFIDSSFKRFRGKTAEEKKKIGQEIIPILSKIEDEIVKNFYVQKFSQRLGVNEESIILQLNKNKPLNEIKKPEEPKEKEVKGKKEKIEEYLLSLLFQTKKIDILLAEEYFNLFSISIHLKLIESLKKYHEKKPKFSSQFFFDFLPLELKDYYNQLFLIDFGENLENENWTNKEIETTVKNLNTVNAKQEIQSLLSNLKEVEGKQDDKEKEIQFKIKQLTDKINNLEK
jgi:DNA primase